MSLFVFVFISAKAVRKHLLLPREENILCWLHPSKIEERGSWVKVRGGA